MDQIVNNILAKNTRRILFLTLLILLASGYQETVYIKAVSVIGCFMPFGAIFVYYISFKSYKKTKFIA